MPLANPLRDELFELIVRRLEGAESDTDRLRLRDILMADRDAREYYVQRLHLMARLRWALGDSSAALTEPTLHGSLQFDRTSPLPAAPLGAPGSASGTPNPASVQLEVAAGRPTPAASTLTRLLAPLVDTLVDLNRLSGLPKAIGLAVAGSLVGYFTVVVLSLVWTRPHREDQNAARANADGASATLAKAVDCRWQGTPPRGIGKRLATGELCLEAGLAQLNFDDGTQVVIEGPACFQLKQPGEMFLSRGRLVAHVPPRAVGFTVETPLARIVDRGTEFGVDADASGRVQVHVFRGSVDWQTRAAAVDSAGGVARPQHLVAGESVVLDGAVSGAPEKVQADADRFARALALANQPASLPTQRGDITARLPVLGGLDLWLDANDIDGDGTPAGSPASASLIATWANKAAKDSGARATAARQSQINRQPVFRPATPRSVASVDFMGNQEEGQCLEVAWPEPWARSYSIFLTGVTRGNDLRNATDYFCDGLDTNNRIALPINPRGLSQVEIGAGLGGLEAIVVPLERARWQSWHLYSIVCDDGECTFSIDGIARGRRVLPAGVLKGLKLGCRFNDSHFLNGAIGEILVYRKAVAEPDQALIERYLLAKWGLR